MYLSAHLLVQAEVIIARRQRDEALQRAVIADKKEQASAIEAQRPRGTHTVRDAAWLRQETNRPMATTEPSPTAWLRQEAGISRDEAAEVCTPSPRSELSFIVASGL